MENIQKQKKIRKFLGVIIFTVAILASIIFFIAAWQDKKELAELEKSYQQLVADKKITDEEFEKKQIQCRQVGEDIYKQEQSEDIGFENLTINASEPTYIYSKKLNTCYYIGGATQYKDSEWSHAFEIKEAYTNQVVSHYTLRDNEVIYGNKDVYDSWYLQIIAQ